MNLKSGDKVLHTGYKNTQSRKGWIGVVVDIAKLRQGITIKWLTNQNGQCIQTIQQGDSPYKDLTKNGQRIYTSNWYEKALIKIEETKMSSEGKSGFIIWCPQSSGGPTVTHSLYTTAKQEAERLATQHPQRQFYIAEIIAVSSAIKAHTETVPRIPQQPTPLPMPPAPHRGY